MGALVDLYGLSTVKELLSSTSYRQFDYWQRNGAIRIAEPPRGSGSRRGYSARDLARLVVLDRIVVSRLYSIGMPHDLVSAVWEALDVPAEEWPTVVLFMYHDGDQWFASRQPVLLVPGAPKVWIAVDVRDAWELDHVR